MNENHVIDNLKKYGPEFQIKCISGILSDKTFLERLSDIIDPTSFESDSHQWIVKQTVAYFMQYKDLPTLNVFKIKVEAIENGILKESVVTQLRNVYQKITDSDLKFVLRSGALLRVVSRKRIVHHPMLQRGDRIAITRDGSGIFPLDGSRVTGCQFLGFHGGISSNRFVFHTAAKLPIKVNSF